MTLPATTTAPESSANSVASSASGWAGVRNDGDLQFAPVTIPEVKPPEPSWFERMLSDFFAFLADLFAPLGAALGGSWWWLQWVLLGAVILFVVVLLVRMFGPLVGPRQTRAGQENDGGWLPDQAATLALLEDADRLAAEGRFDEATHLLLQRSVGQIAAARPGWVEPSSTARELAALAALPDDARTAFRVIAERVERSLFALSTLDRADWEAARAAYAEFALAKLGRTEIAA